ncbi:MAG: hypothetical protein ABSE16_21435 [Verrucomicrobiota bacterium]|jgi:hypothetical protein
MEDGQGCKRRAEIRILTQRRQEDKGAKAARAAKIAKRLFPKFFVFYAFFVVKAGLVVLCGEPEFNRRDRKDRKEGKPQRRQKDFLHQGSEGRKVGRKMRAETSRLRPASAFFCPYFSASDFLLSHSSVFIRVHP